MWLLGAFSGPGGWAALPLPQPREQQAPRRASVVSAAWKRSKPRSGGGGGKRGGGGSSSGGAAKEREREREREASKTGFGFGFGGGASSQAVRKRSEEQQEWRPPREQREQLQPRLSQVEASVDTSILSSDSEVEEAWEAPAELSDSEVAELLGQERDPQDALAGADEAVEARLAWALGHFPFTLDPFQVKAVRHLLAGRSVVVCAPTGAGKTAIAEAAAIHYVEQGRRVIYTTPLKALSNQKLLELRERFGTDGVGLQTGDASINIDAPVVVMTTEILRNVLYRVDADGSSAAERLQDVALVVLDEVHYLGDRDRGSVWEEVIINTPPHVQLLCMSATVRNPEDLGGWISQVHGECDTVTTTWRPVPLSWHFGFAHKGAARLLPLLDDSQRALNQSLLPPAKRFAALEATTEEEWGRWDLGSDADGSGGGRRGREREPRSVRSMKLRTLEELVGSQEGNEDDDWHKEPRWKRIPELEAAVLELAERAMLPAIWFIFSRRDCDGSVQRLHENGVSLTTPEEREAIQAELDALAAEQPEAVKEPAVAPLLGGAAAHHAGCLPAWKSLIERLFQRGLVKVVFATETLAAGINMPARTTLISALSRRRDSGIVALAHNELLQMAGRAGRRGYDTTGHCVVLQSRWEDAETAWGIIKKGPEALKSQFSTGYNMVLNLLYTRGMEEAKAFIDRSFSRYLGGAGHQRRLREIAGLEAKAQAILDEVAAKTGGVLDTDKGAQMWARYQKVMGRLREEKRAAKLLREQLAEERGFVAETVLAKLGLPRPVGLDLSASNIDDSTYRLPALAVRRLARRPGAAAAEGALGLPLGGYLCLAADNSLYKVDARHIAGVLEGPFPGDNPEADAEAASAAVLRLADDLRRSSWQELAGGVESAPGSALTALVAARLPPGDMLTPVVPGEDGRAALRAQRQRVRQVKVELAEIKGDRSFAKAAKKYSKQTTQAQALLERAAALRDLLELEVGGSWKAFEDLAAILQETGAFNIEEGGRVEFQALGNVAREVSGANELWLALVLTHPAPQTLSPPQLAGVLSAVVAPESVSRPSVWVAYPATEAVVGVVEALDNAREGLLARQIRAGVDIPVAVDLRMAGVVEAWAAGCSWGEVMADCTGVDDGDMARLLTRTVDLLKQVSHCEDLLPPMRQAARAAARAMDRPPISDLVT